MGLQIRLRHALGERVVVVRARSVDFPLVIGRSKESDLQIPSVTVAARHCVMFVQNGHWVVQDLAGITSLNDAAVSGPGALHVGDVLTVGTGNAPATIEIDPAGVEAGRTGAPAAEIVATPLPPLPVAAQVSAPATPRPTQAAGIPSFEQLTRPTDRIIPGMRPPPPPAPVPPIESAAPAENADAVDWGVPPDPGWQRFYVPRRKQNVGPMIAVGMLAALAIIGGTIAIVHHLRPAPLVAQATVPVRKIVVDDTKHLKNMFDMPGNIPLPAKAPVAPPPQSPAAPANDGPDNAASPGSSPVHSPVVVDAAPGVSPPASTADLENTVSHNDPDWSDVESTAIAGQPAIAILKIIDYSQKHPGVNQVELKKFENECLDRLWWQRVIQLCNKRARLNKEIAQKAEDLREATTADFKAQTAAAKQALETERQSADKILRNEMGYTDDDAPDIADKLQMERLRAARNIDLYTPWGERTEKYIRQSHGQTPWAGDE